MTTLAGVTFWSVIPTTETFGRLIPRLARPVAVASGRPVTPMEWATGTLALRSVTVIAITQAATVRVRGSAAALPRNAAGSV